MLRDADTVAAVIDAECDVKECNYLSLVLFPWRIQDDLKLPNPEAASEAWEAWQKLAAACDQTANDKWIEELNTLIA